MTDGTTHELANDDRGVAYQRPAGEPPSVSVVEALARERGKAATALETCLYEYVDPDALDTIFGETQTGGPREPGRVTFGIGDKTITVEPELVRVRPEE